MKNAEKTRKTVTRISAGVIFACLLMMTLQVNFQGNNSNSPLSLSSLTFGLVQPAMAEQTPPLGYAYCYSKSQKYDGYAYIDCSTCKRIVGWWGTGPKSTCKEN